VAGGQDGRGTAAEAQTRIKWLEDQLAEAKGKIGELETELKKVKAKNSN
jgi:hypothetical protein